jgi:hypothetical protein
MLRVRTHKIGCRRECLHGVVNQPGIGETPSDRAELLRAIETHFLCALGLPSGID